MKIVCESVRDYLTGKTPENIVSDIKRQLSSDAKIIKEAEGFTVYKIDNPSSVGNIIKNFGSKDEEIFYNFYLVLDNVPDMYKQIIGVKVSPEEVVYAMDAKGNSVPAEYLSKFE